ncbi:hypothetical protein D9Q98_008217 [Chlorella vulgaris]|uniref:Ribosomal eL28/Mak16 domain-containing protein n=1 Tax=Chlorella vulgaris TaxID=3077 RepID=A0A9D4TG96_CHLVU|nr:hypothetical protein D9Q98_008217 [Chlorella vulgaris]
MLSLTVHFCARRHQGPALLTLNGSPAAASFVGLAYSHISSNQAAMSSQLVWELVKKNNCFIRKNAAVNGAVFSTEAGNLANKSSYKYSGLANRSNTVDVSLTPAGDALVLSKSSKKSKIGALTGSVAKKNARRSNHAAGAVASSTRPDLKRAAQARASALTKGMRNTKAAAPAPAQ